MRVVAGELRGRRLESPRGDAVRPTSDRAREALFSILGDVGGLEVLDLYCGTGALGIEALSRGAARATLVDTDTRPAARNVEVLGLTSRTELVRGDAIGYLGSGDARFGLILCDPPYTLADRLAPELRKALPGRLSPQGALVVESLASAPLELGPAFALEDDRRYGAASLRIWRHER